MSAPRAARLARAALHDLQTELSKRRHDLRSSGVYLDVLGRALADGQSVSSVVRSLRTREDPRFFFDRSDTAKIVRELESAAPGWCNRTIADAERICDHTVRLLGADAVNLDAAGSARPASEGRGCLPWHEDVLTGYRWDPDVFYRRIPIPYGLADIKVPWELSRCQHLPVLGMGYAISHDDRYAREVVVQIEDWIRCNRPGYGVNWACTMDVALRVVSWLWAFHLIVQAPSVSDAFIERFLASLLAHGQHIARNLEIYRGGVTTNHTLADYIGLLYLGLLLPEFREASGWAQAAIAGIDHCMRFQVGPDGVDFENSIAYHRLVLEMFASSALLAERNGRSFPSAYRASLERMFEFVYHYTRPDGLAPLIGDSDDGRLQILSHYFDWQPQDHLYLLAVGAVMFERDDFATRVRSAPRAAEEAIWLLGPTVPQWLSGGPERYDSSGSRAFRHSGRYVMRHGHHQAIVCADEVGTAGLGNHKHNDIFGYELTVEGVAMVVDRGSYLYTSDPSARDYFRSTRAHSTVVVDGLEQNELIGPFGMTRDALVAVRTWRSGEHVDVFDATHTGYRRLSRPVVHRRRILFRKDPFAWIVLDTLMGQGRHEAECFLHLAPEGELSPGIHPQIAQSEVDDAISLANDEVAVGESLDAQLPFAATYLRGGTAVSIVPLNWPSVATSSGWCAPRYGQRVDAPVVCFHGQLECDVTAGYLVLLA